MSDVTQILSQIEQGDGSAAEQLLPLVYDELRKLAAARLAQEKPGQTLQPTALVHEAYVRLVGTDNVQKWDTRGHFFAAAAEAIRRILIDQARRKAGPKAGSDRQRVELSDVSIGVAAETAWDMLDLDEAIDQLETEDPRAAKVVKLRYFAGLQREEAAEVLGISIKTADNDWAYARGWLRARLASVTEVDH
ncbi:MAG: sigma-70 family RNA polymerase sigma factor [Fuerstiella sp.]|nr:sigma-70 family RNA polymerase sigma factor [Fuerstiella sp.]MCP4855662.1 sigma-70 family RNA polymerase sigma factor [Fuerstiella sp.]